MKLKLIVVAMLLIISATAAQATLIDYYVSGFGPGTDFWGTISVVNVTANIFIPGNVTGFSATSSLSGPYYSLSAPISPSFTDTTFTNFKLSGASGSQFSIDFTSLIPSGAVDTWAGVVGNSIFGPGPPGAYNFTNAHFTDGTISFNATNGFITFQQQAASNVPEPGTMMLLGSGVLTFGLSRFRRRKETCA